MLPAGDYPHPDVAELGGGHVELPAAEMGNLEELSKVHQHRRSKGSQSSSSVLSVKQALQATCRGSCAAAGSLLGWGWFPRLADL